MPAPPKAAAEQRWIVNLDYLSVEKPGEDPVRYERGAEFPNPTKQHIDDEWVCLKPTNEGGA